MVVQSEQSAAGGGVFLGWKLLIRIGILWLIPALPLWFIESWMYADWPLTSILHTHRCINFRTYSATANWNDETCLDYRAYFALMIQQLTRMITSPALNVNVAFNNYMGWDEIFPHYWQFWLFISAEAAIGLFLLNFFLAKRFRYARL